MTFQQVGDVAARVVGTAGAAQGRAVDPAMDRAIAARHDEQEFADALHAQAMRGLREDKAERDARAMRRHVLEWLLTLPRDEALIICSVFLDEAGAGHVDFDCEDRVLSEAESWAGWAAPHELRAYAKACLDRLSKDHPLLGERTRKALLVDLWSTLPAAWRVEFLRRVDPSGDFVGRAQGGGE